MISKIKKYIKGPSNQNISALEARAASSFVVLEKIDYILDAFNKSNTNDEGHVLIKVYGLLQALFVSIDAMYDLAIGLTNYKYHLNINKNKVLHELKYIRNDVVGHPTHRTYNNLATGFAVIDYENININTISYKTIVFKGKKQTISTRTVYFNELINNFNSEKEIFLSDLYNYLDTKPMDDKCLVLTANMFDSPSMNILINIKETFLQQNPNVSSNHRFLWRIELLELALNWTEDNVDFQELINYIIKFQSQKLHQIQSDLNDTKSNLPYISLPNILSKLYRYLKKHPKLVLYIQNLHDYDHPNFNNDLNYILTKVRNSPDMLSFFTWFSNIKEEEKIYLIGSQIKAFRQT